MNFGNHLEHFSLRWNKFDDNMKSGFHDLLRTEDFVDVTIAAEGKLIQAHKMVLSVCSPYFKNIFKMNPCQHPVVFLKDVTHKELSGILQFMYLGEVSVQQEELGRFLKTAEALQIKGLTGDKNDNDSNEKIESVIKSHQDTLESSITNKKFFNNDYISKELYSKKMKLSPMNELVQSDSSVVVRNSVDPALNNNGTVDEENDNNDYCQDQSENFFFKSEIDDVEVSDIESDRISLKENGISNSDSFAAENVNFKERDNPSPNSGLAQEFLSGIQGMSNDSFSMPDANQGLEFFPLLKKNQGRCPICGRILQHKKNLHTHIADQHSGMFRSWPCQICHKVCKTWSALRVHTNRHHAKVNGQSKTDVVQALH